MIEIYQMAVVMVSAEASFSLFFVSLYLRASEKGWVMEIYDPPYQCYEVGWWVLGLHVGMA